MTTEQFLHVMAMVETTNQPLSWGDYNKAGLPLAFCRWQCHIARLFDEAEKYGLYPLVNEALDDFVGRVLAVIFLHWSDRGRTPEAIAEFWHQGHWAPEADWDAQYLARFRAYAKQVV